MIGKQIPIADEISPYGLEQAMNDSSLVRLIVPVALLVMLTLAACFGYTLASILAWLL
jgi:hypothetical protein